MIIAMTLFTVSVVTYRYMFQTSQNFKKAIEKGFIVPDLDEDWSRQEKTVILALSTECSFCTDSSNFYKLLTDKSDQNREIKIMAVFPQDKKVSEIYLKNIGVKIDTVKQAKLRDLGVIATPTIILVDSKRQVVDSWVGKLDEKSQTEVVEAIFKRNH